MPADFETVPAPSGWFAPPNADCLPPGRHFACVRNGEGYLAGSFPAGITSIGGAPVEAQVTVRLRHPGRASDGVVVASALSSPAGVWSVQQLAPEMSFDVYGRKSGYNDVVASDITPWVGGEPSPGAGIHAKLTSYWGLSESSGVRYDSKGTNHLTPVGAITTTTGLRGGADIAANFPGGNNACLWVANNTSLQTPPEGAHATFGWFKRTTPSSNSTLFSKWDAFSGGSLERSVSMNTSQLIASYQRGGGYYHTTTASPSEDNWHFVVVWVDPADKLPRIQIDNGPVTVNTLDIATVATTNNFAIGGTAGPMYRGYFAHIGPMQGCGWIRGDILTPDERTWLYNAGMGRTYADIVAAVSG